MTTPLTQALDRLMSRQDARHAWLMRAGPVARRLNEEARLDHENKSERRSSGWHRRARKRIRDRDGGLCCWCHEPMLFDAPQWHPDCASLEHIIPLRRGGSNEDDNLALAHLRCNRARDKKDQAPANDPSPRSHLADELDGETAA